MAFEGFPSNAITISLPSGLTYTSVFFPRGPASDKPTVLFLHGFPSSSWDWHNQIRYFSGLGYPVIAPDLLGYGGTSSPTSLEPYKFKNMAENVIAILRHCGIKLDDGEKIHVVGHDFGCLLMSVLLGYFPNIALSASFLAVPYTPPGVEVNLDRIKEASERELGYEFFGFWRFLMSDDCWKIIGEHKESFFTLSYGPEDLKKSEWHPAGKLEAWLRADRNIGYEPWMSREYKETRDKIFASEDCYGGPTNWYRARFQEGLGVEEERRDLGEFN